jgi:peptide/nickel transport system ATP-binding protein
VIRYMCDRVGVMYRGKLDEKGETEQVVGNPAHAYTRALISAVPRPDPRQRGMIGRHRYNPNEATPA